MEKMREAVAEVPGVAASFTQPIALRVDELVSGVKSAIGIRNQFSASDATNPILVNDFFDLPEPDGIRPIAFRVGWWSLEI